MAERLDDLWAEREISEALHHRKVRRKPKPWWTSMDQHAAEITQLARRPKGSYQMVAEWLARNKSVRVSRYQVRNWVRSRHPDIFAARARTRR